MQHKDKKSRVAFVYKNNNNKSCVTRWPTQIAAELGRVKAEPKQLKRDSKKPK